MKTGPDKTEQDGWTMTADKADYDRPLPTSKGVLTAAEIEALLRPDLPKTLPDAEPQTIRPRLPAQFDDAERSPDLEPLRREAGAMASRLALGLARSTGLKAAIGLSEVAEIKLVDLPALMANKSAAMACFGPSESCVTHVLALPGAFADAIIAQACGARGSTGRIGNGWDLSAIDCALLEQLLAPLGGALRDGATLQALETHVPYVTSLLHTETVTISEYSAEAPGFQSAFAVVSCTPEAGAETPQRGRVKTSPVKAVLTARIASLSVPLSRLTSLKAGSTLLLGLPGDQPVDILSGDREGPVAFEGQIGRKGNRMAVKITRKCRGVLD